MRRTSRSLPTRSRTSSTEIQGINSVFVSASLPVSVNTQGTFLNQVFVGMFRPDQAGSPKWLGNVKQYQLKYDPATSAYASPTPTASMPSMRARASYPFWREATGRPRRPSGPTGCRARPPRRAIRRTAPKCRRAPRRSGQREANLTTQASRNVYTCAVDATTGAPACVANALLSAPRSTRRR